MATEFLQASAIVRKSFTQYSSSLANLQTALRADIPALGGSFEVLATTAAPATAIIVTPNSGPVLSMVSGDWIGLNGGTWEIVPNASMGRKVADAVTTSASATVTSATAAFVAGDVGATIATPNLPIGTAITVVGSGTSVTVSANATASGSSQTITVTPATARYTPVTI